MTMMDRVERLANGVAWLNARLLPAPMHRLDRWLVKNRPLIWRTGLHWVAWWTLVLSTLLALGCAWLVRSPRTCWSGAELRAALASVQYVSLTIGVCGSVLQLRRRVPELSWPRHAQLALANAACVALLCAPAPVMVLATTYQMARAIPSSELEADLALHERYHFWDCSPRITRGELAAQEVRITRALDRFGLTTSFAINAESCGQGTRRLVIVGDGVSEYRAAQWLHDRVETIKFSQDLWGSKKGDYYKLCRSLFQLCCWVVLFTTLGLGLLSLPLYVWSRRLPRLPARALRLPSLRVPWLQRLDHWLLLHAPVVWAARLPSLFFYGAFVGGLLWLVGKVLPSTPKASLYLCYSAAPFVTSWPLVWLAMRREDLSQALPRGWRALVICALVAAFSVPSFALGGAAWLEAHGAKETGVAMGVASALGLFIAVVCASAALIRAYQTRLGTFLLLALSLFGGLVLADIYSALHDEDPRLAGGSGLALFVGGPATLWALTHVAKAPLWPRFCHFLAKMLLLVGPLFSLMSWFTLKSSFEAMYGSLGEQVASLATGASLVFISVGFYLFALRPVISVVAATDREPKAN